MARRGYTREFKVEKEAFQGRAYVRLLCRVCGNEMSFGADYAAAHGFG